MPGRRENRSKIQDRERVPYKLKVPGSREGFQGPFVPMLAHNQWYASSKTASTYLGKSLTVGLH